MSDPSSDVTLANAWLSSVNDALAKSDLDAFTNCIASDGWLRDILVFKPSRESRRGHALIKEYLKDKFLNAGIGKLNFDSHPHGRPHPSAFGLNTPVVEAAIDFETPKAIGKGYVRIQKPTVEEESSEQCPKALMLMLMVSDWKGHEECSHEPGVFEDHKLSWSEVRTQRRAAIERDPLVIVLGAGQSGLQLTARLQQNGLRTLLVEKTARIGDVWRNRYPTLTLHTPRAQHCFAYQPFPSNWPTYTPKDKLADWMEQYAISQDLVVWTSSTLEPGAKYSTRTRRWSVTINRNGVPIALRPAYIVVAAGVWGGDPVMPSLPGTELFPGSIIHSSAFTGGDSYAGKRLIVVGAGNTAADVCQDLVTRGAAEVTMVQRSETAVVSVKYLTATVSMVYPEDRPTYYSDLAVTGIPHGAFRDLGKSLQAFQEDFDKELLQGLRKANFKVKGPESKDFVSQMFMVFERGGGFTVDVGCGQLIIDGIVKVKQGVELERLTEKGVVYSDGSEQDADAIIFSTSWRPISETLSRLFGADTVERMEKVWGGDEYGELRAGYRPSGAPGLYVAVGDFGTSRQYSKILVNYIKGLELGYFPPEAAE